MYFSWLLKQIRGSTVMKTSKSLLLFLVCLISLNQSPLIQGQENATRASPFITVKTAKTMQQTLTDLNQAISNNNYTFIRQQNINSRLTTATAENDGVKLVYFCNFSMLSRALNIDSRVGVFLPCKITLIQREDHVEMVAVNPKFISARINDNRLDKICDQLTRDYSRILKEAAI